MKRIQSFFLLSFVFMSALFANPINDLLRRILPDNGDAAKFVCTVTGGNTQQFTLSCDGSTITINGSDAIAVATGINWYLQHYTGIDISWNCPKATLPPDLPVCDAQTHTASVDWRYYLNFCTYSYSMSFWNWERWQQELDWMALHGINMPLAITGMECVWRKVLEDYGYASLADVNSFVCGSAYYGWFFMNNLTVWGGPQPESWYTQQLTLARRIFQRMKDLGMSPVVPGYVGMIPKDFLSRAAASKVSVWKPEDIVDGGIWCSFTRPAFVNNIDRMKEFAAQYYDAFNTLFGDVCSTHFYAIDPFHEGGVPSGVSSAAASVAAMWTALQRHDKDAIWVAQHWQSNPATFVTHIIPRGKLIILDLHGDQYADTQCSGHHTTADGENHDWVWGQVSNFGGNVGLFGRMDRLINCFYEARNNKAENKLVGIGALPEGIENNAMLYDLLYSLPWTTTDYTRSTWLEDYVKMRYGLFPSSQSPAAVDTSRLDRKDVYSILLSAWQRLGAGIYNCPNNNQQGTTESVFLMRPSLTAGTVSSWANSTWYWDFADIRTALCEMLSVQEAMKDNDNYRYDLVDLARQALADYGKELLDEIKEIREQATREGEQATREGEQATREGEQATREGMQETREGMQATREGMQETREGMQETREGMQVTRERMQATREGMQETREGMQETREGMQETREGMQETREGMQETREGMQETREGMQETREGMQEIREKSAQKKSEKKSEQQLIDLFLQLILDQDRLLGTRSEFRLGRWTEAARAHALPSVSVLGGFAAESDLYERNARMLLTTWGDRPQCENGGLHDYANREWNGLLSSYYYPRWKAFFKNCNTAQHWFNDFEWPFATGATGIINSYLPKGAPYSYGSFRATPEGDEITMTQELFDKYFK